MGRQVFFPDGITFEEAALPANASEPNFYERRMAAGGVMRNTVRLTVTGSAADVTAHFVDDAVWGIREPVTTVDAETGEESTVITDYDWSAYSIAGDVVDHRDGRCSVYMAKPTDAEMQIKALMAQLAAMQGGQA